RRDVGAWLRLPRIAGSPQDYWRSYTSTATPGAATSRSGAGVGGVSTDTRPASRRCSRMRAAATTAPRSTARSWSAAPGQGRPARSASRRSRCASSSGGAGEPARRARRNARSGSLARPSASAASSRRRSASAPPTRPWRRMARSGCEPSRWATLATPGERQGERDAELALHEVLAGLAAEAEPGEDHLVVHLELRALERDLALAADRARGDGVRGRTLEVGIEGRQRETLDLRHEMRARA